MADCLFCAIVAGESPSTEVLSTDLVYAFRDLHPVAPTHVLVVPREHIVDAADISPAHGELLAEMFEVARRVAEPRASPSAATASCSTSARTPATASPTCTCTSSVAAGSPGRRAD